MRTLLADRCTRLFFLAVAICALGDDALMLALAVWVRDITGSTSLAVLDLGAASLGTMLAPLTGVLVDRVRRRPLLLTTYAVTGLVLLTLFAVHDRRQYPLVLVVTFVYGLSGALSSGAESALVKVLVPADRLADANGLLQTLFFGLRLVTPVLGIGALALWGGHTVALIDAATFAVAIAFLLGVRVTEPAPEPVAGWRREFTAGARYLGTRPVLRQTALASGATFLIIGASNALAMQAIIVGLHRPATWIGWMVVLQGIGGVLGGTLSGRLARRFGERRLMVAALLVIAALMPLVAIPDIVVVGFVGAAEGLAMPWFFVATSTIVQRHTPGDLIGRVTGVNSLAVQGAQALGNAIGAALVATLFYREVAYVMAAATALIPLYLATRRAWPPAPSPITEPAIPADAAA